MITESKIRAIVITDIPTLKTVIEANELFPPQMLDEMTSDYFHGDNNQTEYWLTYEEAEKAIAIAYVAPEKMTEGTWNLYLIAVHPLHQGKGIGSLMLRYIEQKLTQRGERILLVETSGLDNFELTRQFYRRAGYEQEATIRDFYQAGEDKIIFRKSLI